MAPPTSARYASLYDTYTSEDGKTYIAKMVNGEMTWVPLACGHSQEPKVPASVMDVGDVLIGEDKKEYIVKMLQGNKVWSFNGKRQDKDKDKHKKDKACKATSNFPSVPAEVLDIGDVQVSDDGTEYIVKLVNGDKQYILHQKSYKWSKTGVLYTSLESGDSGCYRPSPTKGKTFSKKKIQA